MFGDLLAHQPCLGAGGDHLVGLQWLGAVGGLDHRADPFASFQVGQANHGHCGDFGVGVEDVLDFFSRDVLAFADDDVLNPSGD